MHNLGNGHSGNQGLAFFYHTIQASKTPLLSTLLLIQWISVLSIFPVPVVETMWTLSTGETSNIIWWTFMYILLSLFLVINDHLHFHGLAISTFHKFNPKYSIHCLILLPTMSALSGILSVLAFWRTPPRALWPAQHTLAMLYAWSPFSSLSGILGAYCSDASEHWFDLCLLPL